MFLIKPLLFYIKGMLLMPNSEELQTVADKLHKNRDIQVQFFMLLIFFMLFYALFFLAEKITSFLLLMYTKDVLYLKGFFNFLKFVLFSPSKFTSTCIKFIIF